MIENWVDEILLFDFKIVHVPGIENHLPDALSRFYDSDQRTLEKPNYGALLGSLIAREEKIPELADVFTVALGSDDLDFLEDKELQKVLMERAHLSGHIGAADMVRLIKSVNKSTWSNIYRECQSLVARCIQCQRYNVGVHGEKE